MHPAASHGYRTSDENESQTRGGDVVPVSPIENLKFPAKVATPAQVEEVREDFARQLAAKAAREKNEK